MEIIACPNCGSRRIFQGTMGDGVLVGYTFKEVCRNCGYQGMPIIFDSEKEYKKFLKEKIKKNNPYTKIEEEKILTQKMPKGLIILSIIIILEAIFSIYLYYKLLLVRVYDFIWIYYISIFIISAIILPYGFLNKRQWAWTVGGTLFAFSIPIGLIFLFYLTRPHIKSYFGKC